MTLARVSMLFYFAFSVMACTKPNETAVYSIVASEPVYENKVYSYSLPIDACTLNDGTYGFNSTPPAECSNNSGQTINNTNLTSKNLS